MRLCYDIHTVIFSFLTFHNKHRYRNICKLFSIKIHITNFANISKKMIKKLDNKILQQYPYITKLNLFGNKVVSSVNYLILLKELDASFMNRLTSSGIINCVNLEEIKADGSSLRISIINKLPKLKSYSYINHYTKTSLDQNGLHYCNNLEFLNIINNKNVYDINHLTKLKVLKANHININGFMCCTELENLSINHHKFYNNNLNNLNTFNNLKVLNVICSDITSDMIRSCNNIEELYVTNCLKIYDINHLTKLRKLDAMLSCSLTNECIKKCTNIEELNLSENMSINDINNLTNLKVLVVNHNKKLTTDGFLLCDNIENLVMSGNDRINDINHLTNLKSLDISGKCILDIHGFLNCKNIEVLNVSFNRIIRDLNHLTNLRKLYDSCTYEMNDNNIKCCSKLECII